MSTKKLSRTIIEGGRANPNKWERRHSNSAERASSRDFCKKAIVDNEIVYDDFITERDKVYKDFDDKLTPVLRWLAKQVGKKWDDVYSEIKQTFDVRTTSGRHIVNDHLIGSVEITPDVRFPSFNDDNTTSRKYDFYVEDGILCQRKYIGRHHYKYHYTRFDRSSIAFWLDGRMIAKIGNKYYWFVSSTNKNGHMIEYKTTWDNTMWGYGQLQYLCLTPKAVYDSDRKLIKYEYVWKEPFLGRIYSFRQDIELSNKNMEFWCSIPEQLQEVVLKFNPLKLKEKPNYR